MITINHVTKKFGPEKAAVNDTTWTVPDGAITGFIGPNGAGKTTTLKMITGVLKPDEGQILINDTENYDYGCANPQSFCVDPGRADDGA